MNVWLANPFDPLPGERLRVGRYASFAKVLGEAGHTVTWWTSAFSHATKSYRDARTCGGCLPDGVTVAMLPAPTYFQNIGIRRLISHFAWARNLHNETRATGVPPDVVIASSPPLYGANVAVRVAHRRNARVIIDVQDLWPEAFRIVLPPPMRWLGMTLLQPLKALEDANFRQADGLTAISQTLLDRALAVNPEKKTGRVIPLGVDVEVYERASRMGRSPWQKPGHEFWVAYVGTIGKTYDIDTILEAALLLKEREPNIRFFIVGSGPLLQASQKKAHDWGLWNVVFTGFMPLDTVAQLLVQSDVGINAIAHGAVSAFPNKVFDYLAAGLPVVNSVKGELRAFIQQHGIGVSYEAGQAESLRDAILVLYKEAELRVQMGKRGGQLARERFDRQVAYSALLDVIEQLV